MELENVAYLEDGDITSDGKLKIHDNDKPVVIMLSGNFCGYCTKFKPEFQKVANKLNGKKVYTAMIVIDEQQKLGEELNKYIPNFRGVPTVVIFKDGKYQETYDGPRNSADLIEFIENMK